MSVLESHLAGIAKRWTCENCGSNACSLFAHAETPHLWEARDGIITGHFTNQEDISLDKVVCDRCDFSQTSAEIYRLYD